MDSEVRKMKGLDQILNIGKAHATIYLLLPSCINTIVSSFQKKSTMVRLFLSLLLVSSVFYGFAQGPQKVKVVLLGTMHFTPSESDMYKSEELAIGGEKRQKEIMEVVNKITAFAPDQICIEYPANAQDEADSLYHAYLDGKYTLEDDEVDQLGFRSAQGLKMEHLTCINFTGEFDSDPMVTFAQENGQVDILEHMNAFGQQFVEDVNTTLANESIIDFLRFLNTEESLNRNASIYSNIFVRIGKGKEFPGTELVANWYRTNLHIFTNVLRSVKPTDRAILVIFGQGHIPILKSLFETNPNFEVVSVAEMLKD